LTSLGHEVDVPDLRHTVQAGDPRQFVLTARSAITLDTTIIAGHSGAGFFLPLICVPRLAHTLVFVDAGFPSLSGTTTAGGDFIVQLRSTAIDGILPRWSRWWGDDVMARLLPDPQRREEIESDLPDVPLAFYEAAITMPHNWATTPGGYVLLEPFSLGEQPHRGRLTAGDRSERHRCLTKEPAEFDCFLFGQLIERVDVPVRRSDQPALRARVEVLTDAPSTSSNDALAHRYVDGGLLTPVTPGRHERQSNRIFAVEYAARSACRH
jgi:hypothetical protein